MRFRSFLGAFTLAVVLHATSLVNPAVQASAPASVCTESYAYDSELWVGSWQIDHWAWTEVNGSGCDARVETWIVGSPFGAESDEQVGFAEAEAEWSAGSEPFCGLFAGKSNHWMIDGDGWHELHLYYTATDYAPWC